MIRSLHNFTPPDAINITRVQLLKTWQTDNESLVRRSRLQIYKICFMTLNTFYGSSCKFFFIIRMTIIEQLDKIGAQFLPTTTASNFWIPPLNYEGESVDIRRKTCNIRNWKHLFLDISSIFRLGPLSEEFPQARGFLRIFVTCLFFTVSCWRHAQPPSLATTPCLLSAVAYTLHKILRIRNLTNY
jgi:hypothetical protein